jgi:hypothetical protein
MKSDRKAVPGRKRYLVDDLVDAVNGSGISKGKKKLILDEVIILRKKIH